jgi:hypothetical protein
VSNKPVSSFYMSYWSSLGCNIYRNSGIFLVYKYQQFYFAQILDWLILYCSWPTIYMVTCLIHIICNETVWKDISNFTYQGFYFQAYKLTPLIQISRHQIALVQFCLYSYYSYVRFFIVKAVAIRILIIWDMMLCSFVDEVHLFCRPG